MNKNQLRQLAWQQRQALSAENRLEFGLQISRHLIETIAWSSHDYVHIYLSAAAKNEIDTWPFIEYLWSKQKHISVVSNRINPLLNQIECRLLESKTSYETNGWGITEPSAQSSIIKPKQLDLMILPLLACDCQGNRLGYGKAYYDRLLAECMPTMRRVGINYFPPLAQTIPSESHDIPLDCLVTPEGVFEF
jgi:5-formyltetrahydrofolate cyclo-ligase